MKNLRNTNKNNADVKTSSLKKAGKINYIAVSGAILAVIVLHFAFQFSFIQSENFRMLQNLVKTGQFESTEQIAENTDVPEIIESDDLDNNEAERPVTRKVPRIKKPEVVKRRTPLPVQKHSRPAPKRPVIKRDVPQPETRAERLRKAEKILTGA